MRVNHRYAQERWAHERRERWRMAKDSAFRRKPCVLGMVFDITLRRVHSTEAAIAEVTGFLTLANCAS
jgi:hypothetical protein